MNQFAIPEGQYTATVYTAIKEEHFQDAIEILAVEVQNFPNSRAALSLLAYCHYHSHAYHRASKIYEELVLIYPDVQEYKLYYAQSLYKANMYPEAMCAGMGVTNPHQKQHAILLQAEIKYEQDELGACRTLLEEQCMKDEPDASVNIAAIAFKEGKFHEAREMYLEAMSTTGFQADLAYNIALCYYKENDFEHSLKHVTDVIKHGVQEHPEFSVGRSNLGGVEVVHSVGNSTALQETYLVEAFNLKSAINFKLKKYAYARDALKDMPPRSEEELDPVTLHNQALLHIDEEPTDGLRKLNFLLSNPPFPPETFGNFLLLLCKFQNFNLAADILAENSHLTFKLLSKPVFEYLDAAIMVDMSPEEAYRKFDILASKHVNQFWKLIKQIQVSRSIRDNGAIKAYLEQYDEVLEQYIPVLMAMAHIYWNKDNYSMAEKLFKQSAEFCSEHEVWNLNMAHILYAQESKFEDAIKYYSPIVKAAGDDILSIPAIVLANLCVCHIMTSENEKAEELIQMTEEAEAHVTYTDPDSQCFHLCIINMVIGTLYCAKGNYEFGIGRIIKSLEPDRTLSADTWFYAKRCLVPIMEQMAKHMLVLKDETSSEIIAFLEKADRLGKNMKTNVVTQIDDAGNKSPTTIRYEARKLKEMMLKLQHY